MARGRPRKFDEKEVLRKAADVFRERGFAGTSMQALADAMQMGEQSIYNAFGNKHAVFERALDQYSADSDAALEALTTAEAALPAIEALLMGATQRSQPCLVARTSLSQDADDPDVARRLALHMRNAERAIQQVLENGVERGELVCGDPEGVARYLNTTAVGLSVMARSGSSEASLREVVQVAMRVVSAGSTGR